MSSNSGLECIHGIVTRCVGDVVHESRRADGGIWYRTSIDHTEGFKSALRALVKAHNTHRGSSVSVSFPNPYRFKLTPAAPRRPKP